MTSPTDPFDRDVYCILGLPFDAMNMNGAENAVRAAAAKHLPYMVSTPNLNFLISCLSDEEFRDSVIGSDLSLADGMPVIWIARLLRIPIPERVAGSDLFDKLRNSSAPQLSVYFFGGPDGAARSACQQLANENKGLRCAGYFYPGFASIEDMSNDIIIQNINASNADFLVVSLGAKKGQAWITLNRNQLRVPVISHLGAVVNFVAGTIRRAPLLAKETGFEWLWRIMQEPSLWRRYASDGLNLTKLIMTRILPLAFYNWRHTFLFPQHADAELDIRNDNTQVLTVYLSGSWTKNNKALLRKTFSDIAESQKNIHIDMEYVTYIDSACIALLILLRHIQKQKNKQFIVTSVGSTICRLFKYSGADYLLPSGKN